MSTKDYGVINMLENFDGYSSEFLRLLDDADMTDRNPSCIDDKHYRSDLVAAAKGFSAMIHDLLERSRGNLKKASQFDTANVPARLVAELCQMELEKALEAANKGIFTLREGHTTLPYSVQHAIRYLHRNSDCVEGVSIRMKKFLDFCFLGNTHDPDCEAMFRKVFNPQGVEHWK